MQYFESTSALASTCHSDLTVPGQSSMMVLGDDMVLWSIRGIPAWAIYGPASVLALYSQLPHPLILPLSSTVTALWLWPWLTASLQYTKALYVCVRASLRVLVWDLKCNTIIWNSRIKYVSSIGLKGKSAALVLIQSVQKNKCLDCIQTGRK